MTAYKNNKPIGQVTEILHDKVIYKEHEIKEALKKYSKEKDKK